MVNTILDALFPNYCYLCDLQTNSSVPLCTACRSSLARNDSFCSRCALPLDCAASTYPEPHCPKCQLQPPPFSQVVAPWLYDEHMAFLMHKWKFQGEKQLTAMLADLWMSAKQQSQGIDLIVPVPLHWRRLWHRGFNQADLLAEKIQSLDPELGKTKIDGQLVSRRRATESQAGLGASTRSENVNAVFHSKGSCEGARIAIVDDVMTTGSTVTALSECLLNAGAASVEAWCIARTPAPSQ